MPGKETEVRAAVAAYFIFHDVTIFSLRNGQKQFRGNEIRAVQSSRALQLRYA